MRSPEIPYPKDALIHGLFASLVGVAPGQDEYAIKIVGLDLTSNNYLETAYGVEFEQGLLPAGNKGFDINLLIGVNLSANHTTQYTTIYFQGSQT